eukprot:3501150-Lingulodinium_polyedra.AAC.1
MFDRSAVTQAVSAWTSGATTLTGRAHPSVCAIIPRRRPTAVQEFSAVPAGPYGRSSGSPQRVSRGDWG